MELLYNNIQLNLIKTNILIQMKRFNNQFMCIFFILCAFCLNKDKHNWLRLLSYYAQFDLTYKSIDIITLHNAYEK